jgi:hypothetical protein
MEVVEQLPRTAMDKLDKKKLKADIAKRLEAEGKG